MQFHGITMKGPFLHQVVPTLPIWTPSDIGRQLYCSFDDRFYIGTSTEWKDISQSTTAAPIIVGSSQSIVKNDQGKFFVTAAVPGINLNLSQTTTLGGGYSFTVLALSDITVTAHSSDSIQLGPGGGFVDITAGSSCFFITDGNSHWYQFYMGGGGGDTNTILGATLSLARLL